MHLSSRSINTWVNRAGLVIGAYLWIVGSLIVFIPHSPWAIGSILGVLALSTSGIALACTLLDRLQVVDNDRFRVYYRLGYATVNAEVEDVEKKLETRLPSGKKTLAHNLFVKFGQDVCRNSNPSCTVCPVTSYCAYAKN